MIQTTILHTKFNEQGHPTTGVITVEVVSFETTKTEKIFKIHDNLLVDGMMKLLTRFSFSDCPNLMEATLKGVLSTTGEVARDCRSMTWNLPECTSLGDNFLSNTSGNTTITVNAPKCSALGSTLGDNGIFCRWSGNVKFNITVNIALSTSNNGTPDGDLVGLNSGSTVSYVT